MFDQALLQVNRYKAFNTTFAALHSCMLRQDAEQHSSPAPPNGTPTDQGLACEGFDDLIQLAGHRCRGNCRRPRPLCSRCSGRRRCGPFFVGHRHQGAARIPNGPLFQVCRRRVHGFSIGVQVVPRMASLHRNHAARGTQPLMVLRAIAKRCSVRTAEGSGALL